MQQRRLRLGLALSLVIAAAGSAAGSPRPTPAHRRIGVMADVGVPDGGTASMVLRPLRAVRLHFGVSHNLVSTGVRGGITLAPLRTWVSPTLSLDYGHFPDGDANPAVQMVTGDPTLTSPLLDRVGYDFANAHLGLELGGRWATFYINAGVSRITTAIHGIDTSSDAGSSTSVTLSSDPGVQIWTVSARVGLIVYLLK